MRTTIGVVILLAVALAVVGARLAGYSAYVVTSGSMEPAIAVGSLVVAQGVRSEDVRAGDVVTYALRDRLVTHRVQDIVARDGHIAFVTRGDANDVADPWLAEPVRDVGMVRVAFPLAGFVVAAVQAWWRLIASSLLVWLMLDVLASRIRHRLVPGSAPGAVGS